jgi:pilus assembly protein Flp/PilA
MKDNLIKLWALLSDDEGQNLIEYALVVAVIAFSTVAGMTALSSGINSAFSDAGANLQRLVR